MRAPLEDTNSAAGGFRGYAEFTVALSMAEFMPEREKSWALCLASGPLPLCEGS